MPSVTTEIPPAVDVSALCKTFEESPAVSNVSFSVPQGQSLALVGPSGCGKTTILRMLAGLERPDSGSIVVNGVVFASDTTWVQPERRNLGMVFQDWALFPHLSVLHNVEFGLDKQARAAGQGLESLEMVQLTHLKDRRVHELSGGQAQRVALARALATRPKVMLFDEAFSSLDAQLTVQVRVEVADLMRSLGMASIYVTHDQAEAFDVADQIAVMHEGRLVQSAPPAQVYREPANEWVASFVGHATVVPAVGKGGYVSCCIGEVPVTANVDGPCRVLLRPEALQVAAAPGAGNGVIRRVKFVSGQTTYEIECGAETVAATILGSTSLSPGDSVLVRFCGDSTVTF